MGMIEAHLSDDQLERLLLGRLDSEETAQAEQHILTCQECAARLDDMREYVEAMRAALRKLSKDGRI